MSDAYIVGFAPPDWAACDGQLMPVDQYQALYVLIGNIYGGDSNTFKVPDLRTRSIVGATLSGGSPAYPMGMVGGQLGAAIPVFSHTHTSVATSALTGTVPQDVSVDLPLTNVSLSLNPALVSKDSASSDVPIAGGMIADASCSLYSGPGTDTLALAPIPFTGTASGQGTQDNSFSLPVTGQVTVSPAGSSGSAVWPPSPYLAINNIICVNGLFPSQP
jgi:microcystin-dependent protein